MGYTTATLVEQELRLAAGALTTSSVPSLLAVTDWIEEESATVDGYAGSSVAQLSYTDVIDYDGFDTIELKHSPLISVSKVLYSTSSLGTAGYGLTTEKTENTDFSVDKEKGRLSLLTNNWNPAVGLKRIQVEYDAGYATTPTLIQKLTTKLVAKRVADSSISNIVDQQKDGKSTSVGSINITTSSGFGVSQYRSLMEDISKLTDDVVRGFRVYRFINY